MGTEIEFELVSLPAIGTLSLADGEAVSTGVRYSTGVFRYQPTVDVWGADSFDFIVYDSEDAVSVAPATVDITVIPPRQPHPADGRRVLLRARAPVGFLQPCRDRPGRRGPPAPHLGGSGCPDADHRVYARRKHRGL